MTPNILDLLNYGGGFSGASTPFNPGAALSQIMPYVGGILQMKYPQRPTLASNIVARPGQSVNLQLAQQNPGYAALFGSPLIYG